MTRLDQREEIKLRPISGSVTNRDKQDDEKLKLIKKSKS
jgi:hypothetical protein